MFNQETFQRGPRLMILIVPEPLEIITSPYLPDMDVPESVASDCIVCNPYSVGRKRGADPFQEIARHPFKRMSVSVLSRTASTCPRQTRDTNAICCRQETTLVLFQSSDRLLTVSDSFVQGSQEGDMLSVP